MRWLDDLKEANRKGREESTARWNRLFGSTSLAAPPVAPQQQPTQPVSASHPQPAGSLNRAQSAPPPLSTQPPEHHYPPQSPAYDPEAAGARWATGEENAEYYIDKGRKDGRAQEYKPPHTVKGFVGHWVAGTYFGPRPPFDMFGKPRQRPDIHSSPDPVQQADINAYNKGFKQGRLELPVSERLKKWWL